MIRRRHLQRQHEACPLSPSGVDNDDAAHTKSREETHPITLYTSVV
jgi:hypothetical protein